MTETWFNEGFDVNLQG